MIENPKDRKYSKEHEWVLTDQSEGRLGITAFAQEQLGDVVFVNLPEPGQEITAMGIIGEVESVKAVSDIYSPVSGTVTLVNTDLQDNPQWVNEDPFGKGWMVVVGLSNVSELDALLTSEQYDAFLHDA
jgi:glycine cleavage system H protein